MSALFGGLGPTVSGFVAWGKFGLFVYGQDVSTRRRRRHLPGLARRTPAEVAEYGFKFRDPI